MMRKLIVLALVFVMCSSARAQFEHRSFNLLDKKSGLPHSSVHTIFQDNVGFLWFGTEGGLCRYDGYEMVIFKSENSDSSSLSNNHITSIFEGLEGFLWIGTRNGLNRFDPKTEKFTRYKLNENDIEGNWVTDIKSCKNGGIWVASKGGLYRVIDNSIKLNWPENLQKYLEVYENNGLMMVHYQAYKEFGEGLNDNRIVSLTESKNGDLWVGTDNAGGENGALHLLKTGSNNDYPPLFQKFKHNEKENGASVGRWIMSVYEDNEGWIWGGTWADGLFRLNPQTKEVAVFKHDQDNIQTIGSNNIYQMQQDKSGNLWICTYGGGLNIIPVATLYDERPTFLKNQRNNENPKCLSSNNLKSIIFDRSGMAWIGSMGNGINYTHFNNKFRQLTHDANNKNSLSANKVLSIYEDKEGFIWFGTDKGTIDRYNPRGNTFQHFNVDIPIHNGKTPKNIFAISEFENNSLAIGTEIGLIQFDIETQKFSDLYRKYDVKESFRGQIVSFIKKDKNNHYLISSGALLSKTKQGTKDVVYPEFPIYMNCVLHDSKGDIWFGSSWAGINHYNSNYERIYGYLDTTAADYNVVYSLAESNDGNIYAGTTKGIARVDINSEKLIRYREQDGLSNDFVCGTLVDNNNNLWISSHNGLSKMDLKTNEFTNFYEEDGLVNNEFVEKSFLKTKDGTMYFGGVNGVTIFNPDDITENRYIPNVAITSFKIFNRNVKIGDKTNGIVVLDTAITNKAKIELSYKSNVLSFEFASLDFQASEKNKYAYMMEGVDDDWVYVSSKRRFASYAGLQNGSYIFKVKGSNNDGLWNEEPTRIAIEIIPPFWKRTWFRILVFLSICAITILVIRQRTRALQLSKERLEDEVRAATEEIKIRNNKLNKTQLQLTNIINQVKNELGTASEKLLTATNSQATSIEEISASIGQMTDNINMNAMGAKEMLDKAKHVEKDAALSVDVVLKTADYMKMITKEIDFISEFARMTNLLSLNAAIEAAKAGSYGSSFAVVANQVKKLAEQSKEAAVKIKNLSESGLLLSKDASSTIVDLNTYIKNAVVSIEQISESSQHQSSEANTINVAVQEISKYVSETSLLTEKLDNAISSLSIK